MNRNIGLIVAAGYSSRFDGFKPLAEYEGKTFLENIISKLSLVSDKIYIVTGFNSEKIEEYCERKKINNIQVIHNEDFDKGMFSSIEYGIKKIFQDFKSDFSVMYQPVDIPGVKVDIYKNLINFYSQNSYEMVKPSFKMKGGHPVIFSSNVLENLIMEDSMDKYHNLKEYIKENVHEIGYLNTDDPNILKDFDYRI